MRRIDQVFLEMGRKLNTWFKYFSNSEQKYCIVQRAQLIQTRKEGYRLGRARKVWEYFQWKSFPSSWCCALINDVMWVMGWRLAGDVCWHARELSSSVIRCRTNSIVMSWVPIMSCHLTSLHHYDRLPKLFPSRGEKEGEVTQEFHHCKKNDLVWHLKILKQVDVDRYVHVHFDLFLRHISHTCYPTLWHFSEDWSLKGEKRGRNWRFIFNFASLQRGSIERWWFE